MGFPNPSLFIDYPVVSDTSLVSKKKEQTINFKLVETRAIVLHTLLARDFPSTFFLFNLFFLLASCFLFLHFKAFPNSSFNFELWSR